MRVRPPTSLIVAPAALAVAVALLVPGAAAAASTGGRPAVQVDPTDTTAPAEPATSAPQEAPAGEDEVRLEPTASEAAQRQADADLRSVWIVVAGLAAVAVGLLLLLVLYVRATNPARAATRREARAAKARREAGLPEESQEDEVADPGPTPPAKAPRAAPVLALPGLDDDDDHDDDGPDDIVATDDERVPAPDSADDLVEADEPSPVAAVASDASVEEATADPADPGPTGDSEAAPARPGFEPVPADLPTAVLSRLDDRDGEEGVKVMGAPAPPSAPGPAAPGKPRRRVDTPSKKLATPDAERVLVRPGRAPVRVPAPPSPRPGRPGAKPAPKQDRGSDDRGGAPESADDQ